MSFKDKFSATFPFFLSSTVDSVLELIGDNNKLTRQAMLALGGMARLLSTTNSDLADRIVDTLHSLLDQISGR